MGGRKGNITVSYNVFCFISNDDNVNVHYYMISHYTINYIYGIHLSVVRSIS